MEKSGKLPPAEIVIFPTSRRRPILLPVVQSPYPGANRIRRPDGDPARKVDGFPAELIEETPRSGQNSTSSITLLHSWNCPVPLASLSASSALLPLRPSPLAVYMRILTKLRAR